MSIMIKTQVRMSSGEIREVPFLDNALEIIVKVPKPDESELRRDVNKISFGCFGGRVILYSDGTWRFAK